MRKMCVHHKMSPKMTDFNIQTSVNVKTKQVKQSLLFLLEVKR